MARTKLLLCNHQSPSNFVGGAEFILLDIARSLDRDKFDLLMLANAEGAFTKMARGSGVSVHIIPHDIFWEFLAPGKDITNRFDRFKTAQRGSIEAIAQIIREKGIGALLANCLVNTVPLMAADECRIPTLWMIHEIVHAFDSMRQGLRKMPLFRLKSSRSRLESTKFLQNTLLRYGRMLIFITEISRSKIFASVEWRDRAIVMHPPIRRDIFFAPEPIKKSYPGIPDESFAVVFLGILFPHKGVHDFIQAASEVAKEAANVHFIVAGGTTDQTYLSKLKKMARTKRLRDRILFTGFLEHPLPLIDRADVICMPSLYEEPFGMVVSEGMIRKKAVIAYDTGSIREVIEDGRTGFICPRGNTQALAQKIIQLFRNRDAMKTVGEEAAATARARFNPDNYIAKLEDLVERIVAQ